MTGDVNMTTKGGVLPDIDRSALKFFSQLSDSNKDKVISDLAGLLAGREPILFDLALTG